MAETDVIGHLLDIEHQAAELLLDTQTEADRRISEARTAADAEYKSQYEQMIIELDAWFAEQSRVVTSEHSVLMDTYRSSVDNTQTDVESFNRLLDSLLFAE